MKDKLYCIEIRIGDCEAVKDFFADLPVKEWEYFKAISPYKNFAIDQMIDRLNWLRTED